MTKGVNKTTGKSCRFIDRTGSRNGRLVFVGFDSIDKRTYWKAVCDCGNRTTTLTPTITKSCGCLRIERMRVLGLSSRKYNDEQRKEIRKQRRAIDKAKVKACPIKRMAGRLSRLHRHSLSKINAIKTSSTFTMLGYTPLQFKDHIEKQFCNGMSWENMDKWQIDHIVPISTAKNIDDVIYLNQLHNLRPLFSSENNKKHNKVLTLL